MFRISGIPKIIITIILRYNNIIDYFILKNYLNKPYISGKESMEFSTFFIIIN